MTTRIRRLRRRWVVLAVVIIIVLISYRLLDSTTWIYAYRVVDDHTLLVETVSGPGAWARVTNVTETPTTVTITVGNFFFQLGAGSDVGIIYESVAKLHDPLGDRIVLDGKSGLPVERAPCPPPAPAVSPMSCT